MSDDSHGRSSSYHRWPKCDLQQADHSDCLGFRSMFRESYATWKVTVPIMIPRVHIF